MFLPPRDPLVATFREKRGSTSRKYISEQGIVTPNWLKPFQGFLSHSSDFALEKQSKNLNFQSFLPSTDTFVAAFSETRALTSRKYAAEQSIVIPNGSKTFQTFWLHSSVFPLEEQPKNVNFQSVFTSERPFGGYLQ